MGEPLCPLDKDIAAKLGAVGADLEQDLRVWIEGLTGDKFSSPSFGKSLKNGIILCKLANAISPGIVPKIQTASAPFVQMENINAFLNAEKKLNVPTADLFMTVDLFEEKNIGQVIRSLATLRRITAGGVSVGGSSSAPKSAPSKGSSSSSYTPTAPQKPVSSSGAAPQKPVASSSGGGKFCTECGTKGVPGAKFCGECGAKA